MLQNVVDTSISMRQLLQHFGLKDTGGNRAHLKSRLTLFAINTKHFLGQGWRHGIVGRGGFSKEEFIENVLNNHGNGWQSHDIKLKLYQLGLKEEQCEKCGQDAMWQDELLSLHLDHVDGDKTNYHLENLQILCPNCHSQTKTYCGKNRGECGAIR